MHYHAEVLIEDSIFAGDAVDRAMAPYYEDHNCEEEGHSEEDCPGFWDWKQIGGRWKGAHDLNYNPDEDLSHRTPCSTCGATGKRRDEVIQKQYAESEDKSQFTLLSDGSVEVECNACKGTGMSTLWPSMREPHPRDIIPVEEVSEELDCFTLVLPGEVLFREKWLPSTDEETSGEFVNTEFDGKVKKALRKRGIETGFLVTVDYHS